MPERPPKRDVIPVDLPARPRKRPRQPRSVALVDALKIAGRTILEREGRAALTLQRLSLEAGVAASSIYEYFPTLDALVGAIFADDRDASYHAIAARLRALGPNATLRDGIELAVRGLLEMRGRHVQLDRDVESRSLRYSELERLDIVRNGPVATGIVTAALLDRFADEIGSRERDKRVFLYAQTVPSLIRVVALERPEYLAEPGSVPILVDTLHALLRERSD